MLHTSSGMLIQFSNFLNKFSFFEYLLATSHQHPGKSADRLSPSPARARYQFHTAYKWLDADDPGLLGMGTGCGREPNSKGTAFRSVFISFEKYVLVNWCNHLTSPKVSICFIIEMASVNYKRKCFSSSFLFLLPAFIQWTKPSANEANEMRVIPWRVISFLGKHIMEIECIQYHSKAHITRLMPHLLKYIIKFDEMNSW